MINKEPFTSRGIQLRTYMAIYSYMHVISQKYESIASYINFANATKILTRMHAILHVA